MSDPMNAEIALTCVSGCALVEPYGWTVAAGCPSHDPDARVRVLAAQVRPEEVLPLLMRLADPEGDYCRVCVVCGSRAVAERGVSIATSVKPGGELVAVAWCESTDCQTDRASTKALVQRYRPGTPTPSTPEEGS